MADKEITTKKESGTPETREHMMPFFSLQRRMNEIFDDFWRGFQLPSIDWPSLGDTRLTPKVNVEADAKAIRIQAELPGMDEKDIQVSLNDDVLTISGERRSEKEEKDKNYLRREFSYGSFHRAIPVPPNVQADKIKATFKNGVLKVELPIPEEVARASKKIEVRAG